MSPFPHSSYRPGQREAIESIEAAFAAGKRFVILEAPTGAGKSAIAVTLARRAGNSYVVTAQKMLQDQYVREHPDLAVMKGRSNYPCLIAPTHAAAAPCIAGRKLPECEECPYFTAKDVAMAASNTIMNYAYYLAELNYSGGFTDRDLLVLDEAHNAESALMGFAQTGLSDADLARIGSAMRLPQVFEEHAWFDFAEQVLPELGLRGAALEEEARSVPHASDHSLGLLRAKQFVDSAARRLRHMLASEADGSVEWVVEHWRNASGQGVAFKPVSVSAFAEEFLFTHARRVLLMSATILDPPTYMRALGINEEDCEVVTVGSSFPARNRPILLRPSARLTRHHLEADLPRLTDAVARIIEEHPTEKGVIHAHSYRIAAHLARMLPEAQRGRIISHVDSSGRDAALQAHLQSPDATVLLTPSMTEGINLDGDNARFQVLCKIPYPYLGDAQVRARTDRDPDWYEWRTCLSVVQAYGRSVRSADDYAVTYLLDAGFPAFVRRQQDRLPEWFLEAVESEPV